PLYIGINNLQLQISTVTDTITDYYLYALDQQHVAGKKGFRKNQTEFTGTIVPELTILNRFNLQWISCISTKLFNSTQTNFISTAGIVSFLIPFNNGLLARVILNSGDFKFNFTYREGNVFFNPVYCAYSASIALQLSMR
ncbi:MAG TPA: hypothetical protein VKO63_09535, partial [Chitinispirillaceae bacterium]|nr:hypothetical protein [Chitinispirillaceae bacterium]